MNPNSVICAELLIVPVGVAAPEPVSIVILNVDASPLVKVITLLLTDAELIKLPVLADPPLPEGKVTVLPFSIESS